jgi:hypothetical protein
MGRLDTGSASFLGHDCVPEILERRARLAPLEWVEHCPLDVLNPPIIAQESLARQFADHHQTFRVHQVRIARLKCGDGFGGRIHDADVSCSRDAF